MKPLILGCAAVLAFVVVYSCWFAIADGPPRPGGASDRGSLKPAVLPAGVRRVLFLGDSITYAGQYVAFVESYLVTRHPDLDVEFVNVGLPSETVSGLSEDGHAGGRFPRPDLHERLGRVLQKTKPELVFACYGMNDGIYQPLDELRFAKFREGTERLHEQAEKAGAKIVHLTPPPFDGKRFPGGDGAKYDAVLAQYSRWLLGRRADGWDVVDLHGPMGDYVTARRQEVPGFALAGDGIHPGDLGHWLMARQVLLHLGAADVADADDAAAMLAARPNGRDVYKWVQRRQELTRNAWLSATGHKRPGISAGLPLDEANTKSAEMSRKIADLVNSDG